MDDLSKYFKKIRFSTTHFTLLLVFVFMSCEEAFEEYTDCIEKCTGPGLIEKEYSFATIEPFLKQGDIRIWEHELADYLLTDSISKSDLWLKINFGFFSNIIQEPNRSCCGYDEQNLDYIEKIDLFVINTVTGDTRDASKFFSLSNISDEEQITIQKFNEGDPYYNSDWLDVRLISPDSIPFSAVFDMKLTVTSGLQFLDHTDILHFKKN